MVVEEREVNCREGGRHTKEKHQDEKQLGGEKSKVTKRKRARLPIPSNAGIGEQGQSNEGEPREQHEELYQAPLPCQPFKNFRKALSSDRSREVGADGANELLECISGDDHDEE